MAFGMTPSSIPGVRIRPPNSAPGAKRKKRKVVKRKQPKRPVKRTAQ